MRDPLKDAANRPWPDDTTAVFREGDPSRDLAWIPQTAAQWHRYADGYKEAAERLYESWRQLSDDSLVFPLVFLYRHYTELRVKELLQAVHHLLDLPTDWKCSTTIQLLWWRYVCLFRSYRGRASQLIPTCLSALFLLVSYVHQWPPSNSTDTN